VDEMIELTAVDGASTPKRGRLTTVLIIADHPLIAEAIRRELRSTGACSVIGWLDGRRPCAAAAATAAPDVVAIVELALPELTLARIRDASDALPAAKVVLLTERMEPEWLAKTSASGVGAAISRTIKPASLGTFLCEVARGNAFHTFESTPARRHQRECGLTARELEILRLAATGASNARIAAQLYVTEQTVKFHLSNVYSKLGVANRTEASHYAHVHGFLEARSSAQTAVEAA
jgi:DNA-binding NarL/FixJ family response regulator